MQEKQNQPQSIPPAYAYHYPYLPYSGKQEDVSIIDYWMVIWKWKWLILAISIISVTIALIIALAATPIYRAKVLLSPIEDDGGRGLSILASRYGGLAGMAGIDLGTKKGVSKKDESLAILQSRVFISKFIREENLIHKLFDDVWDKEKGKWNQGLDEIPNIKSATKKMRTILGVTTDRQTNLLTLTVDWKDSVLAADWANKIVRKLNLYIKDQQVDEANKNIEFLRRQLESTNLAENRTMLYDLIKSNTKTIMLANVTDEFAFKVIDPAVVPEIRIKPKRKKTVIVGGMIGLVMSIFLSFASTYVQRLTKSENDDGLECENN